MKNKAFTLIELLVVVLIIGILAAIAVPQYQVSVGKSKYATLKAKTKALAESVNLYYLSTGGQKPLQFSDLDIDLPNISYDTSDPTGFDIYFNDDGQCVVWTNDNNMVSCFFKNRSMGYYFYWNTLKEKYCYANTSNNAYLKVCEQETGKTKAEATCSDYGYCIYWY